MIRQAVAFLGWVRDVVRRGEALVEQHHAGEMSAEERRDLTMRIKAAGDEVERRREVLLAEVRQVAGLTGWSEAAVLRALGVEDGR